MRTITKNCKFCGKEFSYTTNIVTYQIQCNECKAKAYEEKLNNNKYSLIRELKKKQNFESKYIEPQQQDEELTRRMKRTNLWMRYQKENPYIYRQLTENKINDIIEFNQKYKIEPKIKAYYYNMDDYLEYWCNNAGLTPTEAKRKLNIEGQFIIFSDNTILEIER